MRILWKRRIIATGSSSTYPETPPVRPKRKLRRSTCQLLHHNLHLSGGQEIFGRRQKLPVPSRNPNRKEASHHRPRLSRSPRAHRIRRMRGPRNPIHPPNPIPPRRAFNIRTSEVQDWKFPGSLSPPVSSQGHISWNLGKASLHFLLSSVWSFLPTSDS